MPTFGMLGKYKVKLYGRDHNPPHAHFEFSEVVVSIDITKMVVMSIAGSHQKGSSPDAWLC